MRGARGRVGEGEGASTQTGQSLPVLQPQSQASLTPQGEGEPVEGG